MTLMASGPALEALASKIEIKTTCHAYFTDFLAPTGGTKRALIENSDSKNAIRLRHTVGA